jgi:hypothetical protein
MLMTPLPVGLTLSLIGPIPIDVAGVLLLPIDTPRLIFIAIPLMIVFVPLVVVPLVTALIITISLRIHIERSK